MWPVNEGSQPIPLAGERATRSERRVHDDERNAQANALQEEPNTIVSRNASTLPPAHSAPQAALPRSINSSRIELALEVSTTNRGGTHAAVLGSGPQTRMASHSISDDRRFGVYLPNATMRGGNLALHRLAASTLHVLESRPASLPPAPPAAAAVVEQRPPRLRRPTRRCEHSLNYDPPPEYVAFDPHPFFNAEPKPRRRSTTRIIEAVCRDGLRATTCKVGKRLVKHIVDVGKMAKDVPTAFKEAQMKLRSKRARDKLRWLEKRNYLSGQERLLTRQIVE